MGVERVCNRCEISLGVQVDGGEGWGGWGRGGMQVWDGCGMGAEWWMQVCWMWCEVGAEWCMWCGCEIVDVVRDGWMQDGWIGWIGCMGAWVHGCMGAWVHGCMGA